MNNLPTIYVRRQLSRNTLLSTNAEVTLFHILDILVDEVGIKIVEKSPLLDREDETLP